VAPILADGWHQFWQTGGTNSGKLPVPRGVGGGTNRHGSELRGGTVLGLPAVPAGDELSGGTILALKMTGGPILASGGPILASLRTEGWHRFGLYGRPCQR
jgi:hypothetical protein